MDATNGSGPGPSLYELRIWAEEQAAKKATAPRTREHRKRLPPPARPVPVIQPGVTDLEQWARAYPYVLDEPAIERRLPGGKITYLLPRRFRSLTCAANSAMKKSPDDDPNNIKRTAAVEVVDEVTGIVWPIRELIAIDAETHADALKARIDTYIAMHQKRDKAV